LDELDEAGVPMVGGAGLAGSQYASGWAWPVGPSMAGVTRSMVQHAFEAGARTFGVVYDSQHNASLEGAKAFRAYVRELAGAVIKADVGIAPGKPSYGMEAQTFNEGCGENDCDFVAMILTPETGNTYINSQPERLGGRKRGFGRLFTGGPPNLFNERFARDCGKHCDGMLLWTGYTPPIGEHAAGADATRYVQDVKSVDPGIDVSDSFLEGAWLGTELFVQALRDVGGNLTRDRLQQALDRMTFRSDLVTDLNWGDNSHRVANTAVRAVRVVTASGSFVGFQDAGTGWRRDPHPGSLPS
jgi:ABC-type branched-subunit amino acid transport system substrate-binding protein